MLSSFKNTDASVQQGNSIYFLTDKLGFGGVNICKNSVCCQKIGLDPVGVGALDDPSQKKNMNIIKTITILIAYKSTILIVMNSRDIEAPSPTNIIQFSALQTKIYRSVSIEK